MLKKSLISGLVLAAFFAGCSSKTVDIANDNNGSTTLATPNLVEDKQSAQQKIDSAKKAIEDQMKSLYFSVNSYLLTNQMKDTLNANVKQLGDVKVIRIEGNCDERGSDEYNMALGLKRAVYTKDFLIKNGLKNVEIQTVSHGEAHPVCTENTEECWAKNRRVDLKLP
jgi:peptidoglycan-associated lipoprotein